MKEKDLTAAYTPYRVDAMLDDLLFYQPLHKDTTGIYNEYTGLTFLHFEASDSMKIYFDSINKSYRLSSASARNFSPGSSMPSAVSHCRCTLESPGQMILLEAVFGDDSTRSLSFTISFSPDTSFATIRQTTSGIKEWQAEVRELTFAETPAYEKGDTIYGRFRIRQYEKKPSFYNDVWTYFKCRTE